MMFAKVLLVTDENIKPQNHLEFWHNVLKNAVPGRDSQFAKGPIDVLDHSSRSWSYGSKLIIDGTRKHKEEGARESWQPNSEHSAKDLPTHCDIHDQHQIAGGFWFITTKKHQANQGRALGEWARQQPQAKGVKLIAILDHETNPKDFEDCIWTLLNNIDPERDIQILKNNNNEDVFVMDGTPKLASEGFSRDWPDKITMSAEVKSRVDQLFAQELKHLS
jgi:4-hydroxy-3-polyprenylbenzoate decarboxylase